jgi:hypothetical protein
VSAPQVFVLIDALGWELIRNRPFLRLHLPHQQELRTLLGFSSGIIPSILTGRTPAENGMWNLVYYDPEHSPFRGMRKLGIWPWRLLDNRVGRRALTELGRRVLGMGSNFDVSVPPQTLPWFHWAEGRNIYAREGVPGQQSIFDLLNAKGVPHKIYSYKDGVSDSDILSRAVSDISSGSEFYFLYLSELDMFLHLHRADPAKIEAKLAWYEKQLGAVFAAARARDSSARLHVFSDHGMTPVTRHCDMAAAVDGCGFVSPRDYLAVYDSTMARFWFFSDAARNAICSRIGQLDYARILSDDELRGFGVYFPDHRYGEIVALLEPGCIVAEGGFNGKGWRPAGMHGYHPDDANSSAVFLSSHAPTVPLKTVRDIFSIMQEAIA